MFLLGVAWACGAYARGWGMSEGPLIAPTGDRLTRILLFLNLWKFVSPFGAICGSLSLFLIKCKKTGEKCDFLRAE
jgi:hypothetical protein